MLSSSRVYIEIQAPLAQARGIIASTDDWMGEPHRLRDVGYEWEVRRDERPTFIAWQVRPAGLASIFVLISVKLTDAMVSTHVDLSWAVVDHDPVRRLRILDVLRHDTDRLIAAWQQIAVATAPAPHAPPALPDDPEMLALALAVSHPKTVAAFRDMHALNELAAVARLDRSWRATEQGRVPPNLHHIVAELPPAQDHYDLVYAGGGLGLLHAAVMTIRYGYRVLVFDRGEVGCAHREWNISDQELQALVDIGLFTLDELAPVIMRCYADGVIRFTLTHDDHDVQPAELHLPGVLDVGLDAGELLRRTRDRLLAAGGTILDFHDFRAIYAAPAGGVVIEVVDRNGQQRRLGACVLMDGMGAVSPLALARYAGQPFAGVCPTVGTVVRGLEAGSGPGQHNPEVGDILISVDDAQRGRQLIWEGFAGRDDELTVYVFYYDLVGRPRPGLISAQHHSLLDLYEDYFTLLPTYKRPGPNFQHIKPVYGFIPARHTERRTTALPLLGVVPVGDSGAQQSPLTFCGFGSHVRNLDRTTGLLHVALQQKLLKPEALQYISAYQSNVALHWVFSRFMQPWRNPGDVNLLQNVFARVLLDLGTDVAVRFFKDQMRWSDYGRIVNHTLAIYPRIIQTTLEVLGPRATLQWVADYLRFSRAALLAALGQVLGGEGLEYLIRRLERRRPLWAFRLRASMAEWHAMGWHKRPAL